MDSASSKPPPHLRLHVDSPAATTTTNGSAASSGSGSSGGSRSPARRPSPGASGSGGQGQGQACAACKYQRRKCSPDCPLAPYFPADQQLRFLNAHRLFGVKNIQRTLQRISPEHGPEAMRALIYQADARAADPVGGCVRVIHELEAQLRLSRAQLAGVRRQIEICRQAAAAAAAPGHRHDDAVIGLDALYGGGQGGPDPAGAAGLVFHDQQEYNVLRVDGAHHGLDQPPPPQQVYDYFCYDGAAGDEVTSHDGSVQQYGLVDATVSSPVALDEQLQQHCHIEATPFVDTFDVKPQDLPVTMDHNGHANVEQPKVSAVLMDRDLDEPMAEPTVAAGQCHLELGFSSF